MRSASLDVYVAAFLARCGAMRRPGQTKIDEPGLHGLLSISDDPRIRLLVTDDRAHDVLSALLTDARGDHQRHRGCRPLREPRRRPCRLASRNGDGDRLPRPPHRAHGAAARRIGAATGAAARWRRPRGRAAPRAAPAACPQPKDECDSKGAVSA